MYIKRNKTAEHSHFVIQQQLITKHFPFLKCRFMGAVLECKGNIQPSEFCDVYQVIIRYQYGKTPHVRITSPRITPSTKIHMYPSGNLCLFDPRSDPWKRSFNLHETIIPWTAEWLVFYELFKIHGKWLGPEAPHGDQDDKEQQEDAA